MRSLKVSIQEFNRYTNSMYNYTYWWDWQGQCKASCLTNSTLTSCMLTCIHTCCTYMHAYTHTHTAHTMSSMSTCNACTMHMWHTHTHTMTDKHFTQCETTILCEHKYQVRSQAYFKKSSISMDLALWPAIPHFSRTPETCAFISNSFGISYTVCRYSTRHWMSTKLLPSIVSLIQHTYATSLLSSPCSVKFYSHKDRSNRPFHCVTSACWHYTCVVCMCAQCVSVYMHVCRSVCIY